jgi:ribosomal protein L35
MKMRTKKIVAKRFKITKNGIILRRRQNSRHLRYNKSKRQTRKMKHPTTVTAIMGRTIRTFLPYGN